MQNVIKQLQEKKEPTNKRQAVVQKKEEKEKPEPKKPTTKKPAKPTTPQQTAKPTAEVQATIEKLPPAKPVKKGKKKFGKEELAGYEQIEDGGKAGMLLQNTSKKLPVQQEAVDIYGGGDYRPINAYLRNQDTDFTQLDIEIMGVSSKDKKKVKQKIDAAVKKIDSAMQDELPQDTVLTRFVGNNHPIAQALASQKDISGTVFTEQAYSSTSVRTKGAFSGDVKIQIRAPKGTKGLSFSSDLEPPFPNEYEFLLPRGSAFKIVAVKDNVVIVDLIQ